MTSCCCLTLSGLKRPDDGICLATTAAVCFDGGDEVGCSAVVEKECTLPDARQRRRAELIRTCTALGDAICKTFAHVVEEKIGK